MREIFLIFLLSCNVHASKFALDSVFKVIIKDTANKTLDIRCFGAILVITPPQHFLSVDSVFTFLNRDTITKNSQEQMLLFKTTDDTSVVTYAYGGWTFDYSEFSGIWLITDTTTITDHGTELLTRSSVKYRSSQMRVWRKPVTTVGTGMTLIFEGMTPATGPSGQTYVQQRFEDFFILPSGKYYLLTMTNRSLTSDGIVIFYINWLELSGLLCP